MNDEQVITDLHTRWVFGWERDEGDGPFGFQRAFGEFYDFSSPDVRLYDDFAPGRRAATAATEYGSIREPNFHSRATTNVIAMIAIVGSANTPVPGQSFRERPATSVPTMPPPVKSATTSPIATCGCLSCREVCAPG
ncbi:hypothetical protein ACH4FA_35365 [Streptomyces sp. NPDC017966]|uniref:hypothetical protein n=1 Tax=Streptomyces sp. NPDC017966 TaxID=3365023 RepID=UPI0037A7928A